MSHLKPIDHTRPGFGTFYDELPLWSAPFGLLLLERVPLRPGATILDVGAGTGFLSIELAQRCGPGSSVIAVDPWRAGTERLRAKLEYLDLANVRIVEAPVEDADLSGESIDLVVSNLGVNNFARPESALASCYRLAKPGADLLLTTNLEGHMQELYDVFRALLVERGLEHRLGAFDEHVQHRGTVVSISQMLEHAGFEVATVTQRSWPSRFANGAALLRHYFIRLGFLPDWKGVIGDASAADFFAALERRLDDVAHERGELELTIPMACIEARRPPQ